MRNLFAVSTGLALLATVTPACDTGPGAAKEPPVLEITTPTRGLVQAQANAMMVTGTVLPNAHGDAIKSVTVNGTAATVNADGSFAARITMVEGVSLIETTATDANGGTASDTRAVASGELHKVGDNIPAAVTAALSPDAFAKLSQAAGPLLMGLDLGTMLKPMQPMLDKGGSALGAKAYVDGITLGGVNVALTPVNGGIQFRAELDQISGAGHVDYSVVYIPGSTDITVKAAKVVVTGTLNVTPNGMNGFTTKVVSPNVTLTSPVISASGVPGDILGILPLDTLLPLIAPPIIELAMNPLMNTALGALAGPQALDVLGMKLDVQVAPSAVQFASTGALMTIDMKMMIAGAESSPGYIYTKNGKPTLDATTGFQIALADDLANELLAELAATGKLELGVAVPGGLFDTTKIHMTMPPMINADATDGKLRLFLGDMQATFMKGTTAVGQAAINARVDLQVSPAANGNSVALTLGTPEIHINVVDGVANQTGLDDKQLANATSAVLQGQIAQIATLLTAVPLPAVAGLSVSNLSVGSDSGYVMIKGAFN
ncbi:MAG TPA: hypothetical protein VGC42_08605 [Kofleriaceae bacterium]